MKFLPKLSRVKTVVDAIAIRLFIVIVALTVPFVLLQPIVWRAMFNEQPPTTAADIGNVLSLLVTLLTFALAAYGIITYRVIKARLEKDLTEILTKKISDELKPGFDKMHTLSARNAFDQSINEWKHYETELWCEKHNYDPGFEQEDVFKRRVNMAIEYGHEALENVRNLEQEESYELVRLRYDVINNLAYHLATRKFPEDYQVAMDLCDELSELIPVVTEQELGQVVPSDPAQWEEDTEDLVLWANQDALETIAWVYLRFQTVRQPDGTTLYPDLALSILQKLRYKEIFDPGEQKNYDKKYEQIFGLKLDEVQPPDEQQSEISSTA